MSRHPPYFLEQLLPRHESPFVLDKILEQLPFPLGELRWLAIDRQLKLREINLRGREFIRRQAAGRITRGLMPTRAMREQVFHAAQQLVQIKRLREVLIGPHI